MEFFGKKAFRQGAAGTRGSAAREPTETRNPVLKPHQKQPCRDDRNEREHDHHSYDQKNEKKKHKTNTKRAN